jgi:hypothetical protein
MTDVDDDRQQQMMKRKKLLYALTDEERLAYDLRDNQDVRVAFRLFKPMFSCEHCGEAHPSCIMFYDPDGQFVISSGYVNRLRAAGAGKSLKSEELLELLSGAEALCQNCYRKRYHDDRRHYSKAQAALLEEIGDTKREQGCSSCEEDDPSCLDFHHKEGEEKSFNIYGAVKGVGRDEIMREIQKCDTQCANCHCKIHWDERARAAENGDLDSQAGMP